MTLSPFMTWLVWFSLFYVNFADFITSASILFKFTFIILSVTPKPSNPPNMNKDFPKTWQVWPSTACGRKLSKVVSYDFRSYLNILSYVSFSSHPPTMYIHLSFSWWKQNPFLILIFMLLRISTFCSVSFSFILSTELRHSYPSYPPKIYRYEPI